MNYTKILALLMMTTLLTGCTLPSPEEVYGSEEEAPKDWITVSGSFTYLINDVNNSTQETVWVDVNTTHGMIELDYFHYNVTHLSFDIVNNSVLFNNYSFYITGHLEQDGLLWNTGYAPQFGNATLMFATFPFDVTVEYEMKYRVWNGRE
jgi:hypothetical protein